MSAGIEIRRDGAVVSAAFARPEKKNAITSAMYEALIDVFDKAERDPDVGALVLSGAGGVFTAGNDINDFLAVATGAAGSRDIRDAPGWRFISKLAGFEKPLVAAVQGQAVGIGTTLCFHCDLVYASADARFHMPFVNLGLVPEAGAVAARPAALRPRQGRPSSCCSPSRSTPRRRESSASSTPSCRSRRCSRTP